MRYFEPNILQIAVLGVFISIASCQSEPAGPERDCHILSLYELTYHAVEAPKVFDVRTNPPREIRNGTIEYNLFYQWVFLHDRVPVPYPYTEYFIDTVEFLSGSTAIVKSFESDLSRTYQVTRDDCQIDLESPEMILHFELRESGDEIAEHRFAIYEHRLKQSVLDTFVFIEFRLGPFSSYEDIIKQFAQDNQGKYDTIAIERVQNRTKD